MSCPLTYIRHRTVPCLSINSTITDETVIYVYDDSGNILRKVIYDYTTAATLSGSSQTIYYTYDTTWKDKLVSYNGTAITYDAIGNPLTYGDNSFTWNGRRMATFCNGTTTTSYKYNEDGVRTSKTVGDTTTYFFVDGTTILAQRKGNTQNAFFYDANGKRIAFRHGGLIYYYVYNLQGDVTHILDESGNIVGTYEYDAWGQITNLDSLTPVATVNPFRYRGYYYDTESGLYYLNSRYYNPEWGRFLNADNQISTDSSFTGMNLFAYCGNNPVNRTDPTGEAWYHWVIAGAIVAGCAIATVVTCGGFAAAASAVCMVSSGVAAATTASTIAAGAFIGSATVYGMAVVSAACTSSSIEEFNEQGSWGTVAATALGGFSGGYDGYVMSKAQTNQIAPNNETQDTFLPDSFYSKHAPKQSTPYSSYVNYTYNNYTGKYEKSTTYYDFAGRQSVRIDWTNHGYSDHGNPHVHYTIYNSQYRDGVSIRWD